MDNRMLLEILFSGVLIVAFAAASILLFLGKGTKRIITVSEGTPPEEIARRVRRAGASAAVAAVAQTGVLLAWLFETGWLIAVSLVIFIAAVVGFVLSAGESRNKDKPKK